tara:strand:- start:15348 stop:16208 length:861 start_codon:yes stop_codon:yes gene_type:complete
MTDQKKNTGALAAWAGGGGVAVNKAAIAAALLESAAAGSTGDGGDLDFMSFSGQGANYAGWKLGREKKTPDPDSMFVIDPQSAVEGWTCWKGGSPIEKNEWGVFDRATMSVSQSQLKDHGPYSDGDGWQFMMGLSMFDIDAADRQIKFTTTSKSGKNVLADLNKEIAGRILADEPFVPVVALSSEEFTAQGKKNGKPKIVVEGWVSMEEIGVFLSMGDDGDLDDLLAGKYEAAAEPAPKKRAAKKSADPEQEDPEQEDPEQEEEVEQEEEEAPAPAPKRRARRTAA